MAYVLRNEIARLILLLQAVCGIYKKITFSFRVKHAIFSQNPPA